MPSLATPYNKQTNSCDKPISNRKSFIYSPQPFEKPPVNEPSQLENDLSEVLSFFNLGRLKQCQRAGGFANENYFVSSETGSYVVKLLRERSPKDVRSELPYLARITEHDFPAIPYVEAHGQCVLEGDQFAAVAMKRVEGNPPDRSAVACAAMAEALAKLHAIPPTGLQPRKSFLSEDFIAQTIKSLSALVPNEDLNPYIKARELLATFTDALTTTEQRIIHCDFTPNNCLFQGNRIVGVIDWEETTLGNPLLDLANLVLSTCYVESEFDNAMFQAITTTYKSSNQLLKLDYEQLGAALRLAGLAFSLWVYIRWGVGSDDPFVTSSRQLYWRYGLEDLRLTP